MPFASIRRKFTGQEEQVVKQPMKYMKHRVKDLKKVSARSQRSMASDNSVRNTELVSSKRSI